MYRLSFVVLTGLLACLLMVPSDLLAEEAIAENERYSFQEEHDQYGSGKFYQGREIARVMSWHGIDWLERDEREEEERLSLMIEALKLKPGMMVADIGAGSGVITRAVAPLVQPEGKVFALDIQKQMLDALEIKMKELKIDNVVPILGTEDDPNLEPDSIDVAFMVDVYHEFSYPYEMTLALAKSLKPGGRLVFVEYRKEDPKVPILEVHKMSVKQVRKEMAQPEFGLKWKETIDVLPRQHIIIFERIK
ncbi:putative methyltransferase YcgJ [Polystyrenella longa]|uniref:Putative methyltransferase YcgJ n=1 Tax=Polystyrenella longa TaxID=2528007 RepID=A0A518CH47_9PLAN|nr:class I SAM-dependent methyltransferase [Polystyrenella longa]QDU78494.1 putative methyltransferase YcgJ [Polystyrenella longa]